jgi:hypothetical protein
VAPAVIPFVAGLLGLGAGSCAGGVDPGRAPGRAVGLCDQQVALHTVRLSARPEVLLVVDRSASMAEPLPGGRASKWDAMQESLSTLVRDRAAEVDFGLALFPRDDSCGAGEVVVSPAAGTLGAIEEALGAVEPAGETPTHVTLAAARARLGARAAAPGGRFVLLATDGEPTCSSDRDTVRAIEELGADGIRTYVLGYGSRAPEADDLARWARAGATDRAFSADSAAELGGALQAIGQQLILPSCAYPLVLGGGKRASLRIRFGDRAVAAGGDGWSFDAAGGTLVFHGAACAALRAGEVSSIEIDVDCGRAAVE